MLIQYSNDGYCDEDQYEQSGNAAYYDPNNGAGIKSIIILTFLLFYKDYIHVV